MKWWQSPQAGVALHLAAGLASILLAAAVSYVASPDDPYKLGATTVGLVNAVAQPLVSYLRNYGQVVTTADQVVSNGDTVIVPTLGQKPKEG